MVTPNRFSVYLGSTVVATACSLHSANDKLTASVLLRAAHRGYFPVEGKVLNQVGQCVKSRCFHSFLVSEVSQS